MSLAESDRVPQAKVDLIEDCGTSLVCVYIGRTVK